jgi:hypothetical protein
MTTLRVEVTINEENAKEILADIVRKILWYVCHDDDDDDDDDDNKMRFQMVPDNGTEQSGVWVRVLTSDQCKTLNLVEFSPRKITPQNDVDQVLEVMKDASDAGDPIIHESAILGKLGWVTSNGSPDWTRLKHAMKKLQKNGYIERSVK